MINNFSNQSKLMLTIKSIASTNKEDKQKSRKGLYIQMRTLASYMIIDNTLNYFSHIFNINKRLKSSSYLLNLNKPNNENDN